MDEEFKKLLEENIEISRESLRILKGIRRHNRISSAFKIFCWLIIIVAAAGALYFLQPYIKQGLAIINQAQETLSGLQKINGALKGGK